MKPPDRQTLRLAGQIRELLCGLRTSSTTSCQDQVSYLLGQTQRLSTLHHRLALCERFKFSLATPMVLADLREALTDLPYAIAEVQRIVPPERTRPNPSQRDLLHELQQIEEEFGSWTYVPEDKTLSVTTQPIELEEVFLGPFEIKIDLEHLGNPRKYPPYTVEALDPHPAACNEHVTHPHVSDDHLCEGDAAAAIRTSLLDGRLCDFFLLVRSVLDTYNPESPYVKLEHWNGEACNDCGSIMSNDERFYCEACENDFCDACFSYCRSCDNSFCHGCLSECPSCEENTCSDCLQTCRQCLKPCCRNCLDDNNLCPTCQEANEEQENTNESEPSNPAAASSQPCETTVAESNSAGANITSASSETADSGVETIISGAETDDDPDSGIPGTGAPDDADDDTSPETTGDQERQVTAERAA